MNDARFDFGPVPNWRKGGKQTVHSTFLTELEDSNVLEPLASQLEWIIDTKNPIIFDPLTRFQVELAIKVSTKAPDTPARPGAAARENVPAVAAVPAAVGEWGDYTDCPVAEYANFILAPNYFEKGFKAMEISYYNDQPKLHNESWYIPYELNTMLYWMMDPKVKDDLCPEPWNPGRAVPTSDKKWNFDRDGAWHNYAKVALTEGPVRFSYTPLHFWPLFQGTNHRSQVGFVPRALPMSQIGRLIIRAKTVDKFDNIFRIRDGVTNKRYKIEIQKFALCVEEARMTPAGDRSLQSSHKQPAKLTNKTLVWPGVCKLLRNETVPAGSFIHSIKFDDVVYPEIILVFALNKNVTGGSYKYQTHAIDQPHFVQHNVEQISISYGSFATSMNVPDFGTVGDKNAELNVVRNYRKAGVFGMKVDPKIINDQSAANGFRNTDFPHVVFHLVETDGLEEDQPRTRTVPLQTDPSLLTGKEKTLVVNLKFRNPDGSPDNTSFIVYLGYTDSNIMFTNKKFVSPYGLH